VKKLYLAIVLSMISVIGLIAQDLENLGKIKEKDPFKVTGQIRLNGSIASISGLDDRTAPFYYGIHSKINFSFYGLKVPVYFAYRDNSFHYGQNLPRIKVNPKYKWMELQIGDTFLKFNDYTLNQRNVRGIAAIAKPGLFRIKSVYGRIKDLNAYRDTLQLGITEIENYSQKMMGLGIGFGSQRNYVDVYAISAWDDQDSLFYVSQNLAQRSNIVVGSSFKVGLKNGFGIGGNMGISGLTNDVDGLGQEETFELREELPLYTLNATTDVSMAWDVSAYFKSKYFGLNAKVRQVGQSYQPLTIAYLNTNLRNYTVGGYLSALSGKLFLNGTVGIERNNVSKVNANTSQRLVYNVNSSIRFNKSFSTNINYSNFSQNFEARLININELYTYSINNVMRSVAMTYRRDSDVRNWTTQFSFGQNQFETLIEDDQSAGDEYSGLFADLYFNLIFPENDWKFGLRLDRRDYDGTNNSNQNYGAGVDVSKSFLEGQLTLGFRNKYNIIDRNELREGSNLMSNLHASFQTESKRNYSFSLYRIQRVSNVSSDFTEIRSQVSLIQKF